MDHDHARELLAKERARIEEAMAALDRDGALEGDDRVEPGDLDSEDLYQDEFNASRAEDLKRELEALERAEARLADGTYGLSVESGEPIPDGRLEALPDRRAHDRRRGSPRTSGVAPATYDVASLIRRGY